ncbi:MAG: 2-C-methyl-D-erythritol 2,4-cyclodiphosphate synthase [Clostridia bacterium]|nr:2-C-methyl-D-erythritol 2,4-cyclodiphosphate synthase [Clostridia bacterium]
MRIGHGYDVHRLAVGRKLVIGGIEIPYDKGLDGHSDADVLLHAIMDALLGAAALGDIGMMFPDKDPKYKGADSARLLRLVFERVFSLGFTVENLDCTVIAEAPRLADHIPSMRTKIAEIINVSTDRVNVKATTEERLGFTGSGEGIAAHAVVLLNN